ALLLTRVCSIRNRGALHVTSPAQIVELGPPVHGAAVVPHDQIVQPPAVGIYELPLGDMRDQLINERSALVLRHSEDTPCMGGEVQRLAPGFRNGADQHLGYRRHPPAFLLAELGKAEPGARIEDRMLY